MTGVLIVAGALVLAILIVAAGFWIASQRRSDAARSRQIEERLEQLRQPPE
ncbi:MAG TPA: hypothetical protein RMH99_31480 [Sandaracinaceae bacterium LLY-WYZ-13_1]|nr:hypothetical protein [Sandaracinaceae bacterium LLY-WYZ-13_1]